MKLQNDVRENGAPIKSLPAIKNINQFSEVVITTTKTVNPPIHSLLTNWEKVELFLQDINHKTVKIHQNIVD